ncbi:DNA polymerase beta superfamily protein [Halomarina rubra]|uniref:DNA polymerase beta superfamily protein n=1 Tax=Halomarina rubra TaxID=2071873 RepID=A0ABD6AZT1_9EURY|nr:nucleotidyltransferase domain-containing protein [Halomarina rubra]
MTAAGPPELDDLLDDVAADHELTVLAARDVGSRAWNLASESSDYDVGFLFRQEPMDYVTLDGTVSTVHDERGEVEVRGWNVTRFAELLVDSNPTTLEFLHSPLRYREHDALAALEADVADQFRPIGVYHHYRSLAARQYHKYLQRRLLVHGDPEYEIVDETDEEWVVEPLGGERGDDVEVTRLPKDDERYATGAVDRTVKRNLYVIRGVLSAEYVRDTHEFPTLDFPAFVKQEQTRLGDDYDAVRDLVARKRAGEGDAVVGDVFGRERVVLSADIDPEVHGVRGITKERANAFVRETFDA